MQGDLYETVMRHIFDVKSASGELVHYYLGGHYASIINYAREAWGFVPTFMLEDVDLDVKRGSTTTVLSSYIAENHMIYLKHRKMKNIIVSIVGMAGSGKTTYALNSCIGAYLLAGVPWGTALQLTSNSIFFELEGFVKGIKTILESNTWIPCVIADDVGEWLPKYWRDIGLTGVIEFFNLIEQAKDWVGVIVFTAKSFQGSIAANLRDKSDYIVEASEQVLDMFRLDIFEWYLRKDWSDKDTKAKKKRMQYLDPIPATLKMPDEIWRRMIQTRKGLAKKSIGILEDFITVLPEIESQIIEKMRKRREKREASVDSS